MKKYWDKDGKAVYIINHEEMIAISEKLVPECKIYQTVFDLIVKHQGVEELDVI